MNRKFTGVWRARDKPAGDDAIPVYNMKLDYHVINRYSDKPAGDDAIPVYDVIVQLHVIESCRSVLEVTLMDL